MYKYCLFYPKYSYVRIRSKFEFARCLNPSLIPSKKGQRERNRIAEAEERREGNRTMPRDKKKKKEKDRTRQKKPIINSVTPWWYASPLTLPPLLFSLSLCSLAPCLSVQKPSKSFPCISIETSERPFSMEFERISGLGTRLGDFSSGEKKAPSNYTWTHVGRSIFSTGWRWGEARVCRVQRFYPALSTDPSLIVRFNSGFDHHFYSAFLPVKVSPSSDSSETPPPCICMRELFSTLRSLIERRNALNCFWGGNFLPPCKWMPILRVEIGTLESFFRDKGFYLTQLWKKGWKKGYLKIKEYYSWNTYIENIILLLYLRRRRF